MDRNGENRYPATRSIKLYFYNAENKNKVFNLDNIIYRQTKDSIFEDCTLFY